MNPTTRVLEGRGSEAAGSTGGTVRNAKFAVHVYFGNVHLLWFEKLCEGSGPVAFSRERAAAASRKSKYHWRAVMLDGSCKGPGADRELRNCPVVNSPRNGSKSELRV